MVAEPTGSRSTATDNIRSWFFRHGIERCGPPTLPARPKALGAVKVKAVEDAAKAKVAEEAKVAEDATEEEDAARRVHDATMHRSRRRLLLLLSPKSRQYLRMATATSWKEEEEGECPRWTLDWRSAALTRQTSATRPTGTFGAERRCSRDCARDAARRW